jgi:predicted O-methyltransferase YrrM
MHIMPPAVEERYGTPGPCIHEWEFRNLVKLVVDELHPKRGVELGTYSGWFGSLFSHICTESMISVDNAPQALAEASKAGTDRLHYVFKNTQHQETVNEVMRMLGGPIDLLFIDADHYYAGVKKDFDLWSPHVRPGGFVVFHDIEPNHCQPCEVNKFWITLTGNKREFIAPLMVTHKGPGAGCGGIGILVMP